ncbi:DUF2490 domain-containing protein [Flavobacterium suncheonense]|uniref:DUF2490 domain-containing protein n=1 Tax=Flavobacterium suncheonense TaxID=350894 RepID=UPI003FA3B830
MKKHFISTLFFCFFFGTVFSQISPPGLGKTQIADWFAFGVRQELDTIEGKGWQSMSYIGVARKSNPDNYNPFYKPAILVVNQEFYHQFHETWQYSLALSYRRQDEYSDQPPYEHDDPRLKQEFRLYSRLSYIFSTSRIKLVPTFRQEFRKFYSPDFKNLDEDFQFRSRLRLQLTVNLDEDKQHRLIGSSEQLFSISKENKSNTRTDFKYRESRFSLYYSYSPKASPFIFSLGYMNNLVGQKNPFSAHYAGFDIVIENPFKLQQRRKANIKENFE